MIQFLIPAVIVLIAVIIITVIIIRHFPQAASIDLDALPAEQEAAMKAALMERRLKRKILDFKNRLLPIFRKLGLAFSKMGKNVHKRVSQMEQKYRQKPHSMTSEQQQDVKQKIRQLIEAAHQYLEQDNLPEAEAKFIEVLSWDARNIEAYLGLGDVYLEKKEYTQAKETFIYLLKLVKAQEAGDDSLTRFSAGLSEAQISEVHYDYARCLEYLGDLEGAKREIEKVLVRDANNPKYLDKLVELNILLKDKAEAREAFALLKEVNPNNQKLLSLEERIRNI